MTQLNQLSRDLTKSIDYIRGFLNWWMGTITKLEALQKVVPQIKVNGLNPISVHRRWGILQVTCYSVLELRGAILIPEATNFPANTIHLCLPVRSGKVVRGLTFDTHGRFSEIKCVLCSKTVCHHQHYVFRSTLRPSKITHIDF